MASIRFILAIIYSHSEIQNEIKSKISHPGFEPGSSGWGPEIITARPMRLFWQI